MPQHLPPVPLKLRQMFKDYPEHIDRLQDVLTAVAKEPSSATPRLELAVWALEGRLETFKSEARAQLEAAKASGNQDAAHKADLKEGLMSQAAWKHVWIGDKALWDYIDSV